MRPAARWATSRAPARIRAVSGLRPGSKASGRTSSTPSAACAVSPRSRSRRSPRSCSASASTRARSRSSTPIGLQPWPVRQSRRGSSKSTVARRGPARGAAGGFGIAEYRYLRDHTRTFAGLIITRAGAARLGHEEAGQQTVVRIRQRQLLRRARRRHDARTRFPAAKKINRRRRAPSPSSAIASGRAS